MKSLIYLTLLIVYITCPIAGQGNYESPGPERIYLHTDKASYIAGEYLYYKLYLQGNREQSSRYAYLLIRDRNNSTVTQVRLDVINQSSYGSILLPDTLNTDLYQIVCFSNLMRNEEHTFFRKEIVIANRFDEKLDRFMSITKKPGSGIPADKSEGGSIIEENIIIHPDRQVFSPRERISFSVESTDNSEDPIVSLSVAVSEVVPGLQTEPSITDYFANREKEPGINNIKTNRYTFLPELNWAILHGKLIPSPQTTNKKDGLKNFSVFLSTVDTIANLQITTTDSLGHFSFSIDPYYEGKEIILRTREKINGVVELDDKSIISQPYKPSAARDPEGIKDYLSRSLKINQVSRYYSKRAEPDTQLVIVTPKEIPRVYYKDYLKILPSDYLELRDFSEISREILPAFKVRKVNDTFVSGYSNLQYNSDSDEEPVIFLDGVPVDDVSQIIELGSRDIRSIETVSAIRYYGGLKFNGILSVVRNKPAINNIRFKNPSVRYQVLSSQPFTKPKAFNPGSFPGNYPDLRQVLLWEPDIVPVNTEKLMIECFASDIEGKYRISLQGISSKGNPLSGSAIISIESR